MESPPSSGKLETESTSWPDRAISAADAGGVAVLPALGVGLVIASACLAGRSIAAPSIPGSGFGIAGSSTVVGWSVVVIAAAVVATVGTACMRRDRGSFIAMRVAISMWWFLVVVIASASGLLLRDRYSGEGHSLAVTAVWLSIVGIPLIAVLNGELLSDVLRLRNLMVLIGICLALVVPLLAVGVAAKPWAQVDTLRPTTADEITVSIADRHPWAHRPVPRSVTAEHRRVPITTPTSAGDWRFADYAEAVGAGYFTGDFDMINADTGTLRWHVNVPSPSWTNVVVNAKDSLVLISDTRRDGTPRTVAVDADSGTIRWSKDFALTTWQRGYGDNTLLAEDAIVSMSDDGRTMTTHDPADGTSAWQYHVDRDCAIVDVDTRPRIVATVACAGKTTELRFLDARSGTVVSKRPDHGIHEKYELRAVADRYRPKVGYRPNERGEMYDTVVGVVDLTSGRVVHEIESDGWLWDCDSNADCVVLGPRDTVRIRSLSTGRTVNVDVSAPSPKVVLWLADQAIWTTEDGVVIADRRTGKATRVPGVSGEIFVVPGAVIVKGESALYRFEGTR